MSEHVLEITRLLDQVACSPENIPQNHAGKQNQWAFSHIAAVDQKSHPEEHNEHNQRYCSEDSSPPGSGSGLLELLLWGLLRHDRGFRLIPERDTARVHRNSQYLNHPEEHSSQVFDIGGDRRAD